MLPGMPSFFVPTTALLRRFARTFDELFAELPPSRPGKPSRKGTQVEPDAVCVRDGSTYTSEHLNVSPRHLTRLFREELSTTPARYVESIRCDIAKGMPDQGYTATQAAARVGFPATRARAGSSRARCTCHKRPISVASVRRAVTWESNCLRSQQSRSPRRPVHRGLRLATGTVSRRRSTGS